MCFTAGSILTPKPIVAPVFSPTVEPTVEAGAEDEDEEEGGYCCVGGENCCVGGENCTGELETPLTEFGVLNSGSNLLFGCTD